MRSSLLLLAFVSLGSAQVGAQSASFQHIAVVAHLDNAGRLQVSETQEVALEANVNELGRDFGLGSGQRIVLKGLWRLDDGKELALSAGDLKQPDQYAFYPTWIRWSTPPSDASVTRRYRLEFELVNAMAPAWDLPNGEHALDGLHESYGRPDQRAADVWRVWKEAWPKLDRRYRLDHDVLFPGRDDERYGMAQLDYRLEYDDAWQLLNGEGDIGVPTSHSDYRVRRTLEYLPTGRPSGVDFVLSLKRAAAILALPLVGTLLLIVALVGRRVQRLTQAPADRALFEAAVLAEPPELAGQRLTEKESAPSFETFVLRLASERKLAIEVPVRQNEDETLATRLRLIKDRNTLHPYEQEVVDALFGTANEVTPADVSKRQEDFDGDEIVSAAFQRARPPRPKAALVGRLLGMAFFWGGVVLAAASLVGKYVELPYPLFAGIGASFVCAAIPLPLLLRTLAGFALQLVPNTPLDPAGCGALSSLLLSSYAARLFGRFSKRDAVGRKYDDLARAHDWAVDQLKRPRPELLDAWLPHLESIGLRQAVEQWQRRHGSSAATSVPDMSEFAGGAMPLGPAFTGNAPAAPIPEDEHWAEGFLS